MAGTLGDLLQLVDNQTYLGQQVLNVYYYRITSITPLADPYLPTLGDWWESEVLPAITAIQLNSLVHVSREWRNLTNGTDLYTDTTAVPGVQTTGSGNASPSYVSAGFMLQRESLVTRNGYKRFAGISDANIAGNEWLEDGTTISNLEEALASDIFAGLVQVAEPVIVKRPIDVPVASYEYASIGSASFRSLGTQNTRKAGRGV